MKTTTLTLSALAILIGITACNKENFNPSSSDPQDGNAVKVTLSANQENEADTRTAIGETTDSKTAVLWSADDQLSVFDGAGDNKAFSIKSGSGETFGTFEGEVGKTSESYVALYPYQSTATINTDRNTISGVTLKSTQAAVKDSFDPEAALMTAVETDGSLAFKNAVGYIKVTPAFACTKITLISNNSSDALAGTVKISLDSNGTPTASVTADASNSVSISGTIAANTAYYIAVLPATLTGGFTLNLTDSDNNTISKTSSKTLEIKRNTITDLGSISNSIPYVTFSATSEQTFSMEEGGYGDFDGTFEYSVGNGRWRNIGFNDAVRFGGNKGDLRLRGKSAYGTTTADGDNYIIIHFSDDSDVKVKCSGDIRTLIDSTKNYSSASTANAKFKYLFDSCEALTSAPTLPATELAEECYEYMFKGCTSLETAPELPAETLAKSCYSSMFMRCTALKTAPKLPATALAQSCYSYMFMFCTALENAPELPAETLAVDCYDCMFCSCTALKTAPVLPAKTLANLCYYAMFSGCTSLQSDIELPAETLAGSCYYCMFENCTSLTKITLRATSTAENALGDWLKGTVVSDGKTRTICKNKAFTLSEGTDYPTGWTVTNLTD